MKTDLDHLPDRKRRDLARVVEIIFSEFEDVLAIATQKWKRQGRILKVILYGSYARGDWVWDPLGEYFSDYDILVVVNDERLADQVEYWGKADDHLMREYAIAKRLSAPVSLVVHSLQDVNFQLSRGRPFFLDILRDGVALYSLDSQEFVKPSPLDPAEALEEAKVHFAQWFDSANTFFRMAQLARKEGFLKNAAFQLHQATEHLYHTALLVLTLYSPKSHNLNFLRGRAEDVARDLIPIWPRDSRFARRCFELLQQAYVKARYSPHYSIRPEELEWISERVEQLQREVEALCQARLATA